MEEGVSQILEKMEEIRRRREEIKLGGGQ